MAPGRRPASSRQWPVPAVRWRPPTDAFFGVRLGADFSHVRIHTGPEAERSAAALSAHAYTVGNHIVFNRDRFQPGDGGRAPPAGA